MNRALLSIVVLAAVGCSTTPKGQVVRSIPSDSTEYFRTQTEQMAAVAATKDSLFRDLAETTKVLADINTELNSVSTKSKKGVEPVVNPESQLSASPSDRAMVLKKVEDITARLKTSESRLAASQRRVRRLGATSDSLKATLADFQTTIDGLKGMVEGQKTTIANLESELNETKAQVTTLTDANATLTDTVGAMTTRENTVYYVVGTKKELEDKGIIKEVGGTRFLIFTRTGETLKPTDSLDPSLFTAIDRRQVTEIPLPRADKDYKIVTNQNLAFANVPADNKGKFRGNLQITNPENFWTNTRFLIIVED